MAAPETRLFGTDGVRGPVGTVLTPELALSIGRAAASVLEAPRPTLLIVRDTRESGPELEAALASGAAAAGADVFLAGVLPTPAAPIIAGTYSFDLAVAVSASHNPYSDNGIKLFGADGRKLDDELEARVEEAIRSGSTMEPPGGPGRIERLNSAEADYVRGLVSAFELDLTGSRIALDCANGATFRVGPETFSRFGAEVTAIGVEPDGRNINDGRGSTAPEALSRMVSEGEFDIGFAFDGDGDRMVAVDAGGNVRDGDEVISLVASRWRSAGSLPGGVVVTVMSNHGFHTAMEDAGVEVEVTAVGDRHVIEAMDRLGWTLGGEQSGHIIWSGYAQTGDGIASSLLLLAALGGDELGGAIPMDRLPQELVNVPVRDRGALEGSRSIGEAIAAAEAELGSRGRILVRPSGTEPLVRVMVEAPTADDASRICRSVADAVESEIG